MARTTPWMRCRPGAGRGRGGEEPGSGRLGRRRTWSCQAVAQPEAAGRGLRSVNTPPLVLGRPGGPDLPMCGCHSRTLGDGCLLGLTLLSSSTKEDKIGPPSRG